jgi:hypothetical protein
MRIGLSPSAATVAGLFLATGTAWLCPGSPQRLIRTRPSPHAGGNYEIGRNR